ncbi:MAG: hypothetical protein FD174_1085 [Geobacteraceae bacterium]|nr:MAG: hypothetical protein FD174_1085 [Geobacteraceae bacterium]
MKKPFLVFTLSLLAMLTCVPYAPAKDEPLSKPDVLGEETIYTTQRLSRYDTIIIKDFDISQPELDNIDDEEKKDIEPVQATLPKIISSSFVNEINRLKIFKSVEHNTSKKGNAVIVEGKVTKLSGGHGAAKFFLGWMTPQSLRTHIAVSGRLIDAESGKELAVFNDVKSGLTGAGMGYLKEILVNLSGDLGKDLAEFVEKLH